MTIQNLRGYRFFVHISTAFNGFMFTKRANFDEMRKFYTIYASFYEFVMPYIESANPLKR